MPSFNQGRLLGKALDSIFRQNVPVEVFVMDGGSTDESLKEKKKWENYLAFWRSSPDGGQAAAINEGISMATAPYVAWLNSDDWYLDGGLENLLGKLKSNTSAPAAYGRAWNFVEKTGRHYPVKVEEFEERRLAVRCLISQPATLIRRQAWDEVGGVDTSLHKAMDYDLWWRIYRSFGPLVFSEEYIAINREHEATKTRNFRKLHYAEAIAVVRRNYGSVPLKWWLAQPYAVWFKSFLAR